MTEKDKEFLKRLLATFKIEAEEHVRSMTGGLLELEKGPDSKKEADVIETVFRDAHSLKGAARSVNLRNIEGICQSLESSFAALKRNELQASTELFDIYHKVLDYISHILSMSDEELSPSERSRSMELAKLISASTLAAKQEIRNQPGMTHVSGRLEITPDEPRPYVDENRPQQPEEINPVMSETVRIPITKLDPLFMQAEEMILARIASEQRTTELMEINNSFLAWKKESSQWKNHQLSQSTPQLKELFDRNDERLKDLQGKIASVTLSVKQDHRMLRLMVDEHLDTMKTILMLPATSIVESFPKFLRDLARDQGKEVDLVIQGAEIEVDKRILEEMKDPLIHLMRNCIDHGIEKPEERIRMNKSRRGTIKLFFNAKHSRQVEIIVSDDGAGISLDQVRSAAIKTGIIASEDMDKLDSLETLSLVFQSGISTSPIITDISGRGLGLAIVHDKVEKSGGVVSVDSQINVGTSFCILLPMTLATFRGVPVRSEGQVFFLPALSVEKVARFRKQDIKTIESRDTIELEGKIMSVVRLSDTLGLAVHNKRSASDRDAVEDCIHIVILSSANKRIAFQVDEVLGEQQVLVKGLGRQLSRIRNIAGAVVMGNGEVVPVLNTADLLKSASQSIAQEKPENRETEMPEKAGRILLAEDSITSRTLLKNILESAGYEVATAVDGVDAFTQLRSREFDLVVSDVDMPRMSGFELTAKVRENAKLAELPVVLVTALESREDRERGIDAGANAYIVKSSFDQSNLVETVRRLI
jgi:two-component system, chemotaxis family, sensor kinase CheA